MNKVVTVAVLCLGVGAASADEVDELKKQGFVSLFDGKTLSGWTPNENPESWSVMPDGSIRGKGDRSHLFSPKQYTDFVFRADCKTTPGSNGGMYFRTAVGTGWPNGYEAQVNNSHRDPKRTGSLYNFANVLEKHAEDNEWFTQEVTCVGNHIVIKVNGKKVVDFTDDKNTYTKGHFAFQQHDPNSVVYFRNVMVKDLSKGK